MTDSSDLPLGKVAILGAGGFVGSRLVEMFHLSRLAHVIPIVRRVPAIARSSRFHLPFSLADSRDPKALAQVLVGCNSVIDCTVGMPAQIESGSRALIPAAHSAGVRRVVYLSSASVHGQNPMPGSDETSLLSDRQELSYNNAKVRAERRLFSDSNRLGIDLFVLRPSIIFGPRDRWITSLVDQLRVGTAWLLEEGQGICNTIYVDNLIEAIRCCLVAPAISAGQPYIVSDAEEVTWRELYARTAAYLGIDFSSIHQLPVPPKAPITLLNRLNEIRIHPSSQRMIAAVPSTLKGAVKGTLAGLKPQPLPNPWQLQPGEVMPPQDRGMVLLQQCRHRFSSSRASQQLQYHPILSFDQGFERTILWLKWAGI